MGRTSRWRVAIAAAALVAGPGETAAAPDGPARPLLVAVEASEGACDPAEVRRAIGDELQMPTVAPSRTTAERPPDMLLVAVDRARIVISLRAAPDLWVVRAVPAPAQAAQRLRAIAWLAGNLARDQVGPLTASLAAEPPPPPPIAVDPVAAPAPVTEPPPLEPDVVAMERVASARDPDEFPRWAVTVTGGPAMDSPFAWRRINLFPHGQIWRIELQRQRTPAGPILGVALDMGPGEDHLVAAGGLVDMTRGQGRWRLEAIVGAGLELGRPRVVETTSVDDTTLGLSSTTTVSRRLRPALYGRAGGSLVLRLTRAWALISRLEMRATTGDVSFPWLMTATLGPRYTLP